MVQPLPISNFEWSEERDVNVLLEKYAENETNGCIVKCDLEYPAHLHDDHNDYPLAPERKLVTQDMLSPYAANLQHQLGINKDVCEKLVPNLQDKEGYVVDIRNLKFYRDHGLIVKKIHAVITFTQSRWMKRYIDFNTEKRKQAKTDFEKDFFKLMSNSCFGKTMEEPEEPRRHQLHHLEPHLGQERHQERPNHRAQAGLALVRRAHHLQRGLGGHQAKEEGSALEQAHLRRDVHPRLE